MNSLDLRDVAAVEISNQFIASGQVLTFSVTHKNGTKIDINLFADQIGELITVKEEEQ